MAPRWPRLRSARLESPPSSPWLVCSCSRRASTSRQRSLVHTPAVTDRLHRRLPGCCWRGSDTSISLDWPLAATGITSLYGPRPDPLEKRQGFHYGVDMAAEYGTVVQSTAAGRVIVAGWNGGHGRRVVIQHIAGYRTSYSHLSQVTVVAGTWIESGHSIGRVGNSGRSTGPHLHLEVTRFGEHLDPLDLLGTKLSTD